MAMQSIWVATGYDNNGEQTGYEYEYDDGYGTTTQSDIDETLFDLNKVKFTRR